MTAPVIPCASLGETADALNRVRSALAEARYHADRIRAGAEIGSASHFQALEAAELADLTGALRLVLGAVLAAEISSATPEQRAA